MNLEAVDLALVGEEEDVLVGDEVLDVELLGALVADLGAARIGELLLDLEHLFLDDAQDLVGVGKKVLVVGDGAAQAVQLLLNLVALEAGEALQAHLEDGCSLLGGEAETGDHALGSLNVSARGANDVDDLVDVVERHEQALEDVRAGLGLC